MNEELLKEVRTQFARSGGYAVKNKYGTSHFSRMGKLSAESRKQKKIAKGT